MHWSAMSHEELKKVRQQGWDALMDDWHRRHGLSHHTHLGPVLLIPLPNTPLSPEGL